jgi:hypothetical protein
VLAWLMLRAVHMRMSVSMDDGWLTLHEDCIRLVPLERCMATCLSLQACG